MYTSLTSVSSRPAGASRPTGRSSLPPGRRPAPAQRSTHFKSEGKPCPESLSSSDNAAPDDDAAVLLDRACAQRSSPRRSRRCGSSSASAGRSATPRMPITGGAVERDACSSVGSQSPSELRPLSRCPAAANAAGRVVPAAGRRLACDGATAKSPRNANRPRGNPQPGGGFASAWRLFVAARRLLRAERVGSDAKVDRWHRSIVTSAFAIHVGVARGVGAR